MEHINDFILPLKLPLLSSSPLPGVGQEGTLEREEEEMGREEESEWVLTFCLNDVIFLPNCHFFL